jgi:MSHA biogenesis protein MshN
MSLINKMLQDLDSRGSGPSGSLAASVKLAPPSERRVSAPLLIGIVAVAALAVAGGALLWRNYKNTPSLSLLERAKLADVKKAVPAPVVPPAVMVPPPTVDASGSPIVKAQSANAPPVVASTAQASSPAPDAAAATVPSANDAAASAPTVIAANDAPAAANASASATAPKAKPAASSAKATAKSKKDAATAKAAKAAKPTKLASAPSAGLELTNAQRAESEYRRGLASLQEGRNGEAINALEQAVRLDPHHDSARQTVVGLLIEARRSEEALRHLQLGLTLEPRQPAMAMLLARLQMERGASGIETLMRTLPYATGNAEYHAFLAGALARETRHQEAAEQYRLALRGSPQNGAWLIGLGIALQTEKRDAEALDAFKRAKASGSLTPELATYADRRIGALSR